MNTDNIGRFEDLNLFWKNLQIRLNINLEPERRMESVREDYKFYYTPEIGEMVRKMYWKDIQMFGYEF